MKSVARLLLLAVLLCSTFCVLSEQADDQYFRVFTLVEKADALREKGEGAAAVAKYREAYQGLENLRRSYPNWNNKLVTFRMNYVAAKVNEIEKKPAAEPTDSGDGGSNAVSQSSSSTKAGASQVKLLSAGGEPKKVLRFAPTAGDQQDVTMTMKMGVLTKMGEMDIPAVNLPDIIVKLQIKVGSVSGAGDIAYNFAVTGVEVGEAEGVAGPAAEAMKGALGGLKGVTGSGKMSNRGISLGLELKAGGSTDPQTRQTMEQIKQFLAQMTAPLPEEAVGPGAKWETKMPIKSQGMKLDQVIGYELAGMEGDKIQAKMTVTQTAGRQKIENPAMPGMKMDLVKMDGKGSGDSAFSLNQVVPAKSNMAMHSDMAMSLNMGGQNQNMSTAIDIQFRLEAAAVQ